MEYKWLIVILAFLYILFICRYIYKIILNYDNCNPVKTISWIFVIIFFPLIGILVYIIVGRNLNKKQTRFERLRNKINKEERLKDIPTYQDEFYEETHNKEIKTLLTNLSHLPLFPGNTIQLYSNGREKFNHLFQDIEKAENHINILYYTLGDDKIGTEFKEHIIRKVRQGITVRVLYDDLGSDKTHKRYFEELKQAGILVASFSPVKFFKRIRSINYRNHKKIVIIDGKVAYTGGINVKDEYIEGVEWGVWRDVHSRIEGPGAHGLQSVFITDWYYAYDELISGKEYFPKLHCKGNIPLHVVTAEPLGSYDNIMEGMFKAITQAKKSVYIETPYFVPNESIITAIQSIALSGVRIHLVMPEKSDNAKVQYAANSYVQQLLCTDVEVYQYTKGFIHSKLMVIDDEITILGSSNMDIRSFELNFETSVFIYSENVALKAKEIIKHDMNESKRLNLEDWDKRPLHKKFIEAFFRLFSPLL